MKLKGFGRYDFTIRDNILIVRNIETKRLFNPVRDNWHYQRKFQLRDDNGNTVSCNELRIAYCLLKSCSFMDIKKKAVTGTVSCPRLKSEKPLLRQDEKMRKLSDIEFCLEKLKSYYLTGDIGFFIQYAQDSRYQAIATTSALTAAPASALERVYDDAVDAFLNEIIDCSFTSVKPLFGMLCKNLKCAFFRNARR